MGKQAVKKQATVAPLPDMRPGIGALAKDWVLCVACRRVYLRGHYRLGRDGYLLCPWSDCGVGALFSSVAWPDVLKQQPELPEIPRYNSVLNINERIFLLGGFF